MKSAGPWEPVNTDVKIKDMAISMEKDTHYVWAVSCYGDVLHRYGVSSSNPNVKSISLLMLLTLFLD